jgi:hypothetical protein
MDEGSEMSIPINLSDDECTLLGELLKVKQEQLQQESDLAKSQDVGHGDLREQEVLEQLLWHVKLGCSEPPPEDTEPRQIGSYA